MIIFLKRWGEFLGALLICLVLALSPIVPNSLIGIVLLACAGYWIVLTFTENNWLYITPIHVLVFLYWGIATVSVAFSPLKAEAFQGWVKPRSEQNNVQGFWQIAAIAAMVGMLTHGFVDTVLFHFKVIALCWLMLSLIASRYEGVTRG